MYIIFVFYLERSAGLKLCGFSPCFNIPRYKSLKVVKSLQTTKTPHALRPAVNG